MRRDPERAEALLEDLAELFRVALAVDASAVSLDDEIELAGAIWRSSRSASAAGCRWSGSSTRAAGGARVPPLLLQPLVENAVRHGIEPDPKGGVVRIRTRVRHGQAWLSISNTLPEGPPGAVGRAGHGMALQNVRDRLRLMHDLAARFETAADAGWFRVELAVPLPADVTRATRLHAGHRTLSTPLRILIVDDEEPARWRLRSLLEACAQPRCEVVGEAANAVQARVWLSQQPCDLLLLDIALPGTDGLAFADELRASTDAASAPALIFVTAHAEHALQAFELAASDYLTKPVRRERLQAALQRVAGQVALRRGQPRAGAAARRGRARRHRPGPRAAPARGRRAVSEGGAEVRDACARAVAAICSTSRCPTSKPGSATASSASTAMRWSPRRAVRSLERRAIDADDEAGGWAVWLPEIDEWLAVSRRQLQGVREVLQGSERRR